MGAVVCNEKEEMKVATVDVQLGMAGRASTKVNKECTAELRRILQRRRTCSPATKGRDQAPAEVHDTLDGQRTKEQEKAAAMVAGKESWR